MWTFEATKWMLDLPRTHWILGKQSDLGVFEAGIIVPPIEENNDQPNFGGTMN